MSTPRFRKSRSGPGRRPAGSPKLDRHVILRLGLGLARTLPLQDISVVRVAAELGVTAASIRYYLRGRDALTAGIVNAFYRDLLEHWPPMTGDWQADLSAVAEAIYRHYLIYPGVAAYFAAENRFRILAAATRAEDGLAPPLFLERYFAVIRQVGLDVERGTTYAIILLQLLHMAAHATSRHQWPGEHDLLKAHLYSLDDESFPNIAAMRESHLRLSGHVAFKAALDLVVSGLELERRKRSSSKT
jgi:AcrR family transcriptional regulator